MRAANWTSQLSDPGTRPSVGDLGHAKFGDGCAVVSGPKDG
jgi:hypothetical protein